MDNGRINELDAWDTDGMTPLLYAVFVGDVEKVQRLLEMGADPNRPSSTGETPLWYAEDDFGLVEVAKVLRQYRSYCQVVARFETDPRPVAGPDTSSVVGLEKDWTNVSFAF